MPRRTEPPDSFSMRIRKVLEKTSQQELMDTTGIDRSDISGYCNGQKPDFKNLWRICFALDISPSWLLFGRGGPPLSELSIDPDDPAHEVMIQEVERELERYAEKLAFAAKLKKFIAERKRRDKAPDSSNLPKSGNRGS